MCGRGIADGILYICMFIGERNETRLVCVCVFVSLCGIGGGAVEYTGQRRRDFSFSPVVNKKEQLLHVIHVLIPVYMYTIHVRIGVASLNSAPAPTEISAPKWPG